MSVVIPAWNAASSLPACLDALAAQVDAPAFEVLVVDNGSNDGTGEVARAHAAVSRVVEEPRRGSYAARNAGIAASGSGLLAFTDADGVPDAHWVAAGARATRDAPLIGGRVAPVWSPTPTLWEIYDASTYLDQAQYVANEGFAATANLFVRREVFEAVGGFDATLASSGDWELCRRAGRAGFAIAYADDAVVHHRCRATLRETWRLNRRLGAGWKELARRGERPRRARDDPALHWQLPAVVAAAPVPIRRRWLAAAHGAALAARWAGWSLGR